MMEKIRRLRMRQQKTTTGKHKKIIRLGAEAKVFFFPFNASPT